MRVTFYLLSPYAKTESVLYVSIRNKTERLRFATGENFITRYCNVRERKGRKELVKKGSPLYFDYKAKLDAIEDKLHLIEKDLRDANKCSLKAIQDTYCQQTGISAAITFNEAWNQFTTDNKTSWTPNTVKKINGTFNHLKAYEETYGAIKLDAVNESTWNTLRDSYFVGVKRFSNNSTNKYMVIAKQFLMFAKKKGYIKHDIFFEDFKYLEEIGDTFKIALKLHEVEALANLDLSGNPRLDRVRDLFILEILTGQRFSDLPKLLDVKNITPTSIVITQEKTNERVAIPLHPRLKTHLKHIFEKYPAGLPVITNQKFNEFIKEVCALAGFTREHHWRTLCGKEKVNHSDFRYNLVSSHTGRRTFCTLALKNKINAEDIRKVTGHRRYEQFLEYVKVDDEDVETSFSEFMNGKN